MGSSEAPIALVVLVVEDEPLVRMIAADELEEAGFHILEAANADVAMAVLEARSDEVQVLFTDVHMPNSMDGLDLAGQVHARWPHTLLLISSGYARPGLDEIPDARSQTTAVSCRSRIAAPPWCTASQG